MSWTYLSSSLPFSAKTDLIEIGYRIPIDFSRTRTSALEISAKKSPCYHYPSKPERNLGRILLVFLNSCFSEQDWCKTGVCFFCVVAQLPDKSWSSADGIFRNECEQGFQAVQLDSLSSYTAKGTQLHCLVTRSISIFVFLTSMVISSSAIINSKEILNG